MRSDDANPTNEKRKHRVVGLFSHTAPICQIKTKTASQSLPAKRCQVPFWKNRQFPRWHPPDFWVGRCTRPIAFAHRRNLVRVRLFKAQNVTTRAVVFRVTDARGSVPRGPGQIA
ncbi:hypothetical protein RB12716 [Rhodopirellula baltica SH 1]|uniref:Uncharacterized protein n=1 Tax=Rhodopirellula baltica (strain DSM 10527 / NCIMB 13988 / SH1) TaxID=243090 RepID=Q7UI72_RHOBA|nr:hypothetical protein RB12716 [Rhodopirellula baltica SH 1]